MAKIMTFNIRTDVEADGKNRFILRTDLVDKCIKEEAPDIIGFQEVVPVARAYFKKHLPGYVFLGCGRHGKYDGEGVSVAYDAEKYELVKYETFWLSENPSKPASKFSADQSGCPRTCVVAKLVNSEGKIINFYNTHLDHVGPLARLCGAVQVVSHMTSFCKKGETIVLVGDMNAEPGEHSLDVFENAGLCDLTRDLGGTFHNFGKYFPENNKGEDKTVKIDYIYANVIPEEDTAYIVDKYERDGVYVSDHYPVCAEIEL